MAKRFIENHTLTYDFDDRVLSEDFEKELANLLHRVFKRGYRAHCKEWTD